MNTKKLYALVRAFEDLGMNHDAAFEAAFDAYMKVKGK